jgi:hypothetical protein
LGYTKLENDLLIKGVDVRLINIPYVLANIAVTSSLTGAWFEVPSNYKRLYVESKNTTSNSDITYTLQGSHDKVTISTVNTLVLNGNSNTNVELTDLYKYYRIVVTGTVLNAIAELYETIFDRALISAAFTYIFTDARQNEGDVYDLSRRDAVQEYVDAVTSLKFYYDTNDDEKPENDVVEDVQEPYFYR